MLFLNVVLPMDSRIGASLYIVCHGCKGKVQPPLIWQNVQRWFWGYVILRNAMPPKRFEVPFGTGTGRKPETPWTLQARHTLSSTLEASTRPGRFPLSSDTVGVLSKLVEWGCMRIWCQATPSQRAYWPWVFKHESNLDHREHIAIGSIPNWMPHWHKKHTSLLHKMAYRIPLICSLGCSPAVCGKLCLIGASKTCGLAVGNCRILMNKELRTWWSTCASLEAASVAAFGFWLQMSEYGLFWVPMTAEGC